jgi:predicted dehydrogenase
MKNSLNRRRFIQQAGLAAGGIASMLAAGQANASLFRRKGQPKSPNEKLNIGVIGVTGRGGENLKGVSSENIVAVCDVDSANLDKIKPTYPQARRYSDFRKLIDDGEVEAVVVSTPDHTHAVATMAALDAGLPVYCEKPLTHTVSEARAIGNKARSLNLATQMGNQIHAGKNYRRVVELVQSGAIGEVREAHVWVGTSWEAMPRPIEIVPVPSTLDYDLWLGPAAYRPYHPEYIPFKWRRWWAFGGGAMSDFGCHYMDLTHWALSLRYPIVVQSSGPIPHNECAPKWMVTKYTYPARENLAGVKLTWYQGGKLPPQVEDGTVPKWGNGVLFVGEKGMLLADYGRYLLLPEKDFAAFQAPTPFIPDSIGHHAEWILACKNGGGTGSSFDYAAALTESVLLGTVSHRIGNKRMEWDAARMLSPNCPEAAQFVQHEYRRGWSL